MVLYYNCHKANGISVGTFSGLFAGDAAVKGFIKIMKMDKLSSDTSVNFTIKCNDDSDKNHYYYTGTRVHAQNIVELKIVHIDKVFIIDHIEIVRDYDNWDYDDWYYDGLGFSVVNKDTNIDLDIINFSHIVLEL